MADEPRRGKLGLANSDVDVLGFEIDEPRLDIEPDGNVRVGELEAPDAVFVGDVTTSAPVFFPAPGCYYYTLEHVNGPGSSSVSLSATGPGQPTPTLVGLGLLPVFQGVDNPTTCKITAVRRAPASTDAIHDDMDVTITDLDTIGAIFNVLVTNGTAAIVSPGLTPGVSTSIVLRATKTTQGQPTTWSFGVVDWNDNVKLCQ